MAEGAAHARLDGAQRLAKSGGNLGLAEPGGVQREDLSLGGWELGEHTGHLRVAQRAPCVSRWIRGRIDEPLIGVAAVAVTDRAWLVDLRSSPEATQLVERQVVSNAE